MKAGVLSWIAVALFGSTIEMLFSQFCLPSEDTLAQNNMLQTSACNFSRVDQLNYCCSSAGPSSVLETALFSYVSPISTHLCMPDAMTLWVLSIGKCADRLVCVAVSVSVALLNLFINIYLFLWSWAGGILRILQSDWFWERAVFSYLLTTVMVTLFAGNLEMKSFYTGARKECIFARKMKIFTC